MKKYVVKIVKKYAILGSFGYTFKKSEEQNISVNMLRIGLLTTAIIKKFDKTGSAYNVTRKNKEPSRKRKNSKSKLTMVISKDSSFSIKH